MGSGFLCLLKLIKSVKTLLLSVNIFIVVAVAAVIGFTARKNMLNQMQVPFKIITPIIFFMCNGNINRKQE